MKQLNEPFVELWEKVENMLDAELTDIDSSDRREYDRHGPSM